MLKSANIYRLFIIILKNGNSRGYNKNCKQKKEVIPMGRNSETNHIR